MMKISRMNGNDWVKIVLAFSVLLVMVGIIVAIIIHGSDFRYSEIGITALAGIMGAIVGVLGQSVKGSIENEKKESDD